MKREEILNRIIEEHNNVIENLKNTVNRFNSESDLDENDTLDPDDFARQNEAKDLQMRYKQMLDLEEYAHRFILNEKEVNHTEVGEGAVLETELNFFFLGISIPHFTFEGKELFCITKESAIYKKLNNKKVGDSFEMGNKNFEIKNIY